MIWYAVMTDNEDTDHGTGSFDLLEAYTIARKMRNEGYADAYVAAIDTEDDTCICELRW